MPNSAGPLQIEVSWRLNRRWQATGLLKRVAAHVAAAEGFETGRLSVVVLGRRAMARLHERFLGDATATDVLAFDLASTPRPGVLDAEIVLCADVALERCRVGRRQPADRRLVAAARTELALYLAHGILHLAGYDDHTPSGFRRMHTRENELLSALGLGPVFGRVS